MSKPTLVKQGSYVLVCLFLQNNIKRKSPDGLARNEERHLEHHEASPARIEHAIEKIGQVQNG